MQSIWKYTIPIEGEFHLEIPRDAQILSVQVQHNEPCIWVLVDPKAHTVTTPFRIYGTGHPIKGYPGHFIGTFQTHGGDFVWHLFYMPVTTSTA